MPNLLSCGDIQPFRRTNDGIIRLGFQNTNSLQKPITNKIPEEIEVVQNLGIDICGYAETNRPWTLQNKANFDTNMRRLFNNQTHTQYAALPAPHGTEYQPGGVLQTINGSAVGRITQSGSDQYGRYVYHAIRGRRDEGILVITAYRVCQESLGGVGPNTAYMDQYTAMVGNGKRNPRPRKLILRDLLELIREKRQEGYRPILMLDANGSTFTDKDFRQFQQDALLEDPFYDKFNEMPRTYARGSRRIDYILMDAGLTPAIKGIGYLGSHMAVFSDHSMAWCDFHESLLFRGKINRPPPPIRRQFTLNQEDKVEEFMKEFKERIEKKEIANKVVRLLGDFYAEGLTPSLVRQFNNLDKEWVELALGALNKTARRRYGYFRSPELIHAGRLLLLHKAMLDCLRRRAPPSEGVHLLADQTGYDISEFEELTIKTQLRRVAEARQELWNIQKASSQHRINWLEQQAIDAEDKGDSEWSSEMKAMIRTTQEAATNNKLRAITKGHQRGLDRIEVPIDEWIYSAKLKEVYHYRAGVFEAHAMMSTTYDSPVPEKRFYAHHSLKVPDPESVPIVPNIQADGVIAIERVLADMPFQWRQVTEQAEIEKIILERNKRHLQQVSREKGPSTQLPVRQVIEMDGEEAMSSIHKGAYTFRDPDTNEPVEIPQTLATWLDQLVQTEKERDLEPTAGSISPSDLQEAFRKAKEKTASNGELHYTVWKAMVADDEIAAWMAIMISLPFMYGFAPERWTNMTDVMLEKKKGNRQINQLRIIGLLEADFNTALKYFARDMAKKMEDTGELSDEQWGLRKNRNSIDAAMIKLLTFEAARAQKTPIGLLYYDCTACYDRMIPDLSNHEMRKRNFDESILKARAAAVKQLKRHVRTGLGVSEEYYSEEAGDFTLQGEVQGKADNPALFTACSSGILHTHSKLAPGLELQSCTGKRAMRRHNVSYVDDNDGNVSSTYNKERPLDDLICKMKLSSKVWNETVRYTGQSLAYHKCRWQVLAWEMVRGELKLILAVDDVILLEDHKGATSVITFLPPDQPNKGLGYHICPDGNQKQEFDVVMNKLRRISSSTAHAFLTPSETKQLLYQRLMPAIDYVLHATSFSKRQCKQMDTNIRKNIYPHMRFNRHTPAAVMQAPWDQGGMNMPDTYVRQTQLQTEYVIKQLRNGNTVENDFLVTLDIIQLQSGLITPLFEYKGSVPYMDVGYIASLRERLAEIDASIWIEKAWTPSLQREGDKSLMEAFLRRNLTPDTLRKLNAVRIYMRVITLSDIVLEDGATIGHTTCSTRGEFIAGSDLHWPPISKPPKKWFALFRKHVKETFCYSMGRVHHTSSLDLNRPLGKWYPVPRHTWFDSYRGEDAIYKRIDGPDGSSTFQRLTEQPRNSGYYRYEKDVDVLPMATYPIKRLEIGSAVWTRLSYAYNGLPEREPTPKPPGYIVEDTRQPNKAMEVSKTGSDGSVHRAEKTAAAAWIIASKDHEYVKACFLMTKMGSINSYRAELEGMYRALCHIHQLGLTANGPVTQWCDNQGGVIMTDKELKTGTEKMQPEADILMAIQHIKDQLPFPVTSQHVKGHQDTKKSKSAGAARKAEESDCDSLETTESTIAKEKEIDASKLKDEALLNIACDALAGEVSEAAIKSPEEMPPTDELMQMPYKGSCAVLRIGDTWVTANYRDAIYRARRGPIAREYIKQRQNWTDDQYDSVNWDIIGQVRKRSNLDRQRFTCKLMHGWLPVNHVRQHETNIPQCPGCDCEDETIAHLFKCQNDHMRKKREEIVAALRKKGLRRLSRQILGTVADIVEQYAADIDINPKTTKHSLVTKAVEAQSRLGWEAFFRGYLVREWQEALRATHTGDATQQFDQFQQLVWFEISQPQWYARNEVAHGPDNNTARIESARLAAKLGWYHRHRHELLPAEQQVLAERNLHDIRQMRPTTRRAWLRHLEIVTEAWEQRRYHRATNQRTIAEFISSDTLVRPPRRRTIAREAREYADGQVLQREPQQRRIDSIFPRRERPRQHGEDGVEENTHRAARAQKRRQTQIDTFFGRVERST